MKRLLARIGRFFWSWGFLKFVLWTITIIVLFYVEEDWRGARFWAATKAEWEAKGESLDYKKFIPAPIADDQNLGAIPLFKLELQKHYPNDPNDKPQLDDVPLQKALRIHWNGDGVGWDYNCPPKNNWHEGERPDLEKIHHYISAAYVKFFQQSPPSGDPLVQWEAMYPFIANLQAETGRPYCQFPKEYTEGSTSGGPSHLIDSQFDVSKILMIHALLELEKRRPDLALEDLKINFKLADGIRHDPSSFSIYLAFGLALLGEDVIYDGLSQYLWSDAQLVEIEHLLAPLNFLADYQFGLRADAAGAVVDYDWVKHTDGRGKNGWMRGGATVKSPWNDYAFLWPDGWWDLTKSWEVDALLQAQSGIDPKNRRAFPEVVDERARQVQREMALAPSGLVTPWKARADEYVSALAEQCEWCVNDQAWADETRMASALERYRLAHNAYPDSLDALVPTCIAALPSDVINGKPYQYRLRPDGTFLLYSVGWNLADEGGKIAHTKDNPPQAR